MKKFLFIIIMPMMIIIQNSCTGNKTDHLENAEKLTLEGKYDHAVSEYNHLLTEVYFGLGIAEFKRKDYAASIGAFDALLMLDPNNNMAYLMRGEAKYVIKKVDEACLDWSRAAELGNYEAKHHYESHCKK